MRRAVPPNLNRSAPMLDGVAHTLRELRHFSGLGPRGKRDEAKRIAGKKSR
jgi:hypothetical protein